MQNVVIEKMDAFLGVVVLNPTQKEVFEEGNTPQVIVGATVVLAKDEAQAATKVMRFVPEEHAKKIDRLEVKLLPFESVRS